MRVRVDRLDEADAAEWQAYVRRSDSATLFHDLRWSAAVHGCFRHRPMHLVAREGGEIRGILPLFEVRSVFVGRVLVSVPYGVYGGIAADSEAVASALLDACRWWAERLGVNYVELRHLDTNRLGLAVNERYVTFIKALPASAAECLAALPRKARAAARHAINRYRLRAEFHPRLLSAVHDLYARTVRRLGSPVYPRRFFEVLAERFGSQCVCQAVFHEDVMVAGLLSFVFKDRMMPYYSGSLEPYRHTNANNFLYLKAMEYGVEHGCRTFDFGRTRRENVGPYQFKKNQGFEPQLLPYQVLVTNGRAALEAARAVPRLDPGEQRFSVAQQVWRRLPLPVTKWVGAVVTRSIP